MEPLSQDNWLIFEDDDGKAAEYGDFDEQVEMKPEDAAEHRAYVRRLGDEFGIPMPEWTPQVPSRERA